MEKENNGCILVKKKDYEELLKQADANQPTKIIIRNNGYYSWYGSTTKDTRIDLDIDVQNGSIELDSKIIFQVRRIIRQLKASLCKSWEEKFSKEISNRDETIKTLSEEIESIKKMSYWEFRKFKKTLQL